MSQAAAAAAAAAAAPEPSDLVQLDQTVLGSSDGASVIATALQRRFAAQQYSTWAAESLVVVNPFSDATGYTNAAIAVGRNKPLSKRAIALQQGGLCRSGGKPSVAAAAEQALRSALQSGESGLVVMRGQAGSGKSRAAEAVISHLIRRCATPRIDYAKRMEQVEIVFAAFCNARTPNNPDSTRVARFTDISFTNRTHSQAGASVHIYLLDTWRVADTFAFREHNFHIFYYMVVGMGAKLPGRALASHISTFRYLHQDAHTQNSLDVAAFRFRELTSALEALGIPASEQDEVFAVLAAILYLGELKFVPSEAAGTGSASSIALARIDNEAGTVPSSLIASLLHIQRQRLDDILLFAPASSAAPSAAGAAMAARSAANSLRPMTVEQCSANRDGIARSLYERLVAWILYRVNATIAPRPQRPDDREKVLSVGVFDMFGFAAPNMCRFQHLSVNMANETLRHLFVETAFGMEQADIQALNWEPLHINFIPNEQCVAFFLGRPSGLLAMIDHASLATSTTSAGFVSDLDRASGTHACYVKKAGVKPCFGIVHYVGTVFYDAASCIIVNRDYSLPQFLNLLHDSDSSTVQQLGRIAVASSGSLKMNVRGHEAAALNNVGRYRASLRQLINRASSQSVSFVHCIGANASGTHAQFDTSFVQGQVMAMSLLELTWSRKFGYPGRYQHDRFLARFGILNRQPVNQSVVPIDACRALVQRFGLSTAHVAQDMVLLKLADMDKLEAAWVRLNKAALLFQRVLRRPIFRRNLNIARATKRNAETDSFVTSKGPSRPKPQLADGVVDKPDALSIEDLGLRDYEEIESDASDDEYEEQAAADEAELVKLGLDPISSAPRPKRTWSTSKTGSSETLNTRTQRNIRALITGLQVEAPVAHRPPVPLRRPGSNKPETAPPLPPRNASTSGPGSADSITGELNAPNVYEGSPHATPHAPVLHRVSPPSVAPRGPSPPTPTSLSSNAPNKAADTGFGDGASRASFRRQPSIPPATHSRPESPSLAATAAGGSIGATAVTLNTPVGLVEFPTGYHGSISGSQAEALLANQPVGTYVLRDSSSGNNWSISLKATSRVKQFHVVCASPGQFSLKGFSVFYPTIGLLLEQLARVPFTEDGELLGRPLPGPHDNRAGNTVPPPRSVPEFAHEAPRSRPGSATGSTPPPILTSRRPVSSVMAQPSANATQISALQQQLQAIDDRERSAMQAKIRGQLSVAEMGVQLAEFAKQRQQLKMTILELEASGSR
ncbi:hypothetical protein CAOG_07789 [Capsaspora owczarzaki ATCC 30864]|uniref:Myosin motor domain-containing protein n=1 Tax=Capsaspora owczarzaki (strain ATCC 30864) TaxID=595528 RepID=A0A0D2W0G3_CAPO3|nr:hypothetical protein CAOG_07789 [Capsaspora owczarzaki ATCC 30864]KJE97682.1 hypothetical protein CAOG_007789 [Capsaspora owczarzaki ATCC 30864]|eukprot:XP_004342862.1 hypothetical protein CAOG_07789 [Capsaspora owczarzaki ATCC 30864]